MTVMLQPVVVLTGIVSLGRIYNVVGAVVDPFLDNRASVGYQQAAMNKPMKSISRMNSVVLGQVNTNSTDKIVAEEIAAWTRNTHSTCIEGIEMKATHRAMTGGYKNYSSTSDKQVMDKNHTYLYQHVRGNHMCIYQD